jgi:hypothetical protein
VETNKSDRNLSKDASNELVDRNDPLEMQRIQETKPARTKTAAGETSVPENSKSPDNGQNAEHSEETDGAESAEAGSDRSVSDDSLV